MNPDNPQHESLPPDFSPELPPVLVDALRSFDGPPVAPSASHDDALLAGAREHLAGIAIHKHERRGRSRYVLAFIGAGGALAAAAALTFAVMISTDDAKAPAVSATANSDTADSRGPTDPGPADGDPNTADPRLAENATDPPPTASQPDTTPQHARPTALVGDLDGSGTIDILDAFALARSLEQNTAAATSPAHDFNRDGQVDALDADWLAHRAVALQREGGRG